MLLDDHADQSFVCCFFSRVGVSDSYCSVAHPRTTSFAGTYRCRWIISMSQVYILLMFSDTNLFVGITLVGGTANDRSSTATHLGQCTYVYECVFL